MRARGGGQAIRRLRGAARERAVREVLSRWAEAGSTKVEFCRREGITRVTLSRWLAEFPSGRTEVGDARPRFVEAMLGAVVRESYEVVLATGARVLVPQGFDEQDLARLLRVVSAC